MLARMGKPPVAGCAWVPGKKAKRGGQGVHAGSYKRRFPAKGSRPLPKMVHVSLRDI
jgi:hypothetical protein